MTGTRHFTISGFGVHVHPIAMVAAAAAVLFLREVGLVIVGTFFVSILVHELGHSFAFRRYGTESHIVIHLFGGYSSPDMAHKLDHSEWVRTSLAGPAAAFFLLGLPAWLLKEFEVLQYGYPELIARFLVYFCVYWGAANLLPIWPLDGGKVMYHASEGNWQLTRIFTLIMSVPAAILAINLGFRFAAIFIGFNAFRVWTGKAPGASGLPKNANIAGAAKRAKAFAAKPTKTRGSAGLAAVDTVYKEVIRGRTDRAAEPLAALRTSKHRDAAELAHAWGEVIAQRPLTPDHARSELLNAVLTGDPAPVALAMHSCGLSLECAAAIRVLYRQGNLTAVCDLLGRDAAGRERLAELERQTLDLGMVDEQIAVTAALGHTPLSRKD